MERDTSAKSTTEKLVSSIENGGKLGGASGALFYLVGGAVAHRLGMDLDLLSSAAYGAALGGALGGGRQAVKHALGGLDELIADIKDTRPIGEPRERIEPRLQMPVRQAALALPQPAREEWRPTVLAAQTKLNQERPVRQALHADLSHADAEYAYK